MTHDARLEQFAGVHSLAVSARLRRTPCDDGSIVWRDWGAGRPVVLLHGGSGSWTHWVRNITPLVDAGFHVHVPDMPGFGDSTSPAGGEDADAVIAPMMAGLERIVPGPFDLVGFSFGSLVATLLAAHLPRVHGLILLGAPVVPLASGKGVPLTDWRGLETPEEQAAAHASNLQAIMLSRAESITPEAIALHAANVARDRMRRRRLVTTPLLAQTLSQLRCPVSMLYGAQDQLCKDDWAAVHRVMDSLDALRHRLLIGAAGHWVQYEAPDEVNEALLERLDARPLVADEFHRMQETT